MHCPSPCPQVDPAYTGRVGASEAALFLKKSGLPDSTLGKVGAWGGLGLCLLVAALACPAHRPPVSLQIWDLADPEGKGFLDKQVRVLVPRRVSEGPRWGYMGSLGRRLWHRQAVLLQAALVLCSLTTD